VTTATLTSAYRNLTDLEVMVLESQGCTAENWTAVRVAENFDSRCLQHVAFFGTICLGRFGNKVRLAGGLERPTGIYNAVLHNCDVGHDAFICGVGRHISNYRIGDGAVLHHVDLVACEGFSAFGNGSPLHLLREDGGCAIPLYDRLSSQLACLWAARRDCPELLARLGALVAAHARSVTSERGEIGPGAWLVNCGEMINVRVGPAARIIGAARLCEGTIHSSPAAPARIGSGVIAEHFIMAAGGCLDGGAQVRHCFIGQGARLDRQFSAEQSAFFANSLAAHGEAVSALCGPFAVSHHKGSLLIAGQFAFFNAGSGTNQSNHRYKLGPIHQGLLERGCKTGSDAYLGWPARVGAFTTIIGRHSGPLDCSAFPFSYLVEADGRSVLVPAANLCSSGVRRDMLKWPQRERRHDADLLDLVRYDAFSPFTAQKMIEARRVLWAFDEATPADQRYVEWQGVSIPRARLHKSAMAYDMALEVYLGGQLVRRLARWMEHCPASRLVKEISTIPAEGDAEAAGEWVDLCGLLAPKAHVDQFVRAVASGTLPDLLAVEEALRELHTRYDEWEWRWVWQTWLRERGLNQESLTLADLAAAVQRWKEAITQWNNLVLRDAQQEFAPAGQRGALQDAHHAEPLSAGRAAFESHSFVQTLQCETELFQRQAAELLTKLEATGPGTKM
jgi:hypothetical protein